MLHRERFEAEYEPLYRKHRMGTTIWSPLASGVLTGKYLEGIPEGSRFSIDNPILQRIRGQYETEEGKAKMEKVRKLKTVADELGCSLAQLAIAWTIKNPNVSTAILGASRPEQLKETLKSLEVVPKLTPEVLAKIEEILANKPKLPISRF
ncbi:hypothetical protein HK105_208682 [Polyrhizophydium stewartii]|uniref:NADP-dependent oxidoreductase domain-containing protein n=1 Tax=Polyrhizophydium stewartii TaxID=2732419 RepID=A0ABR4MX04_9FUNG